MRVLTLNELMRLTRIELCAFAAQITAALPTFRDGIAPAHRGIHQPAQHPRRPGAARLLALMRNAPDEAIDRYTATNCNRRNESGRGRQEAMSEVSSQVA